MNRISLQTKLALRFATFSIKYNNKIGERGKKENKIEMNSKINYHFFKIDDVINSNFHPLNPFKKN